MNITAELLPWQQRDWEHLARYVTAGRVPQAILFAGHRGIGKHTLVYRFAHTLLCERPKPSGIACGECHACGLTRAKTHPDCIELVPGEPGKAIKIDQIRQIITVLSLKPQYPAHRVVIVDPADQLNIAAVNAFLKFLEEPTERTVLLLITDKPSRLPATLLSRCQKIFVAKPNHQQAESWLNDRGISKDADLLLRIAQGAPLLALNYANDNTLKLRQQCFNELMAVAERRMHPVSAAERWQELDLTMLLTWLFGWVADLIKCRYRLPTEMLVNADANPHLNKLAKRLKLTDIYPFYDHLLVCRARLDTQINKQLLIEELLLKWAKLNES